MLTFRLALPGLQALEVSLSRLQTDVADWTSFWKDRFAPLFYMRTRQDFLTEGAASGDHWAPLSARYAAWKASRFPSKGILVRSGALKASLSGPTAPLAVFRPGATSLEIGTAVPSAIYHQMGTARMPQRPPMRADRAFMQLVGKELQKHVHAAWTLRRQAFRADVTSSLDTAFPTPSFSPGINTGLL